MSEQLITCDRCHREFSASTVERVCERWLCPRCSLLDSAEFCREQGWIGHAMELEAEAKEIKQ